MDQVTVAVKWYILQRNRTGRRVYVKYIRVHLRMLILRIGYGGERSSGLLLPASWGPRKSRGVIQSESEGLRIGGF